MLACVAPVLPQPLLVLRCSWPCFPRLASSEEQLDQKPSDTLPFMPLTSLFEYFVPDTMQRSTTCYWSYWEITSTTTVCYWLYWGLTSISTVCYWLYWELLSANTDCYWFNWELTSTSTVCYWFYWELPRSTPLFHCFYWELPQSPTLYFPPPSICALRVLRGLGQRWCS